MRSNRYWNWSPIFLPCSNAHGNPIRILPCRHAQGNSTRSLPCSNLQGNSTRSIPCSDAQDNSTRFLPCSNRELLRIVHPTRLSKVELLWAEQCLWPSHTDPARQQLSKYLEQMVAIFGGKNHKDNVNLSAIHLRNCFVVLPLSVKPSLCYPTSSFFSQRKHNKKIEPIRMKRTTTQFNLF